MTEKKPELHLVLILDVLGTRMHVERGNARGEWVINGTACWTKEDLFRLRDRLEARP